MWTGPARMVLATAALTSLLSRSSIAAAAAAATPRARLQGSGSAAAAAAAFIRGPTSLSASAASSGRRALSSSSGGGAMKSVADLRKEYSASGLEEGDLPKEPFPLFRQWLEEAVNAQVIEPNAMCLSTVGPGGRPSGRFVLLKGLDDRGFVWYTNYESRKGQELALGGGGEKGKETFASLTFWWGDLERSVRVEGSVEKVSAAESTGYFQSRPRGSQMGAWASNQSRPIASRRALEEQYDGVKARFDAAGEGTPIPKPPHWGGYRLVPDRVEFWKGRQSRLHDRIVYTLEKGGDSWAMQRLQP